MENNAVFLKLNQQESPFDFKAEVTKAKKELEEKNITSERESAWGPLSERIEKSIEPRGYALFRKDFIRFLLNKERDRQTLSEEKFSLEDLEGFEKSNQSYQKSRDDAWRFYLGLPQKYGTFSISDYQPKESKEKKYYYSVPELEQKIFDLFREESDNKDYLNPLRLVPGDKYGRNPAHMKVGDSYVLQEPYIMGHYTLSYAQDERGHYLSYYDIWDINPIGRKIELGKMLKLGKSFEIYNRIYFNPETKERV